uniref:Arginine vasopressin-induced protein 1 n=1 Tax=Oryzias melastigma TaxID=30732 RepID=A0A3B3D1L7_ORYME
MIKSRISSDFLLDSSSTTLKMFTNRKAGSGNIFSNVNLWQLQRLFKAAGDHDAEQRAKLVWGLRDEADLAQALIGLRARSHRKRLRTNGRSALGSHWLQAFSHLR